MKNRLKRTKQWLADHEEFVIITGVIALYAGMVAVAVKIDKQQQAADEENMKILGEAIASGKQIIPGPNGMFWIMNPQSA